MGFSTSNRPLDLLIFPVRYVWGCSGSTAVPQAVDAGTLLPLLPDSNQRPRVINDAMEVVRRIGHRFLWVDRYCILQSDHSSKLIQIQNMGKIYSASILTIIASAGNNVDYGLPGVGLGPRVEFIWTTIPYGKTTIPVVHFEPPSNDILNSKWNSRGWTYQEALLSKRTLVFTDRQVYFQCKWMHSIGHIADKAVAMNHEWRYPSPDSEVFPFPKAEEAVGVLEWERTIWERIRDYSKRELSYEEDALHAVQGILESYHHHKYRVWFLHGLPVVGECYSPNLVPSQPQEPGLYVYRSGKTPNVPRLEPPI